MTDQIEERILATLLHDGRASIRSIASEAGLSESAASARLTTLQQAERFHVTAMLHPSMVGTPILYVARVAVVDPDDVPMESRPIQASPWVTAVHGEPAVCIQGSVKDVGELSIIVRDLEAEPWITAVDLTVVFAVHSGRGSAGETSSSVGQWAAPRDRVLDDVDRQLITLLNDDGRAKYSALARVVGLSVAATRRRVIGLLEDGTIRISTIISDTAHREVRAVLHVEVRSEGRQEFIDEATRTIGVSYVNEVARSHSVQCDLAAPSADALTDLVDVLTARPHVLRHRAETIQVLRHRQRWTSETVD